jgi:pilus assembly protein FimV
MPIGKNRLMLMMALAMPGAAQALGLGDIHVDSALNEHLAAEIDLVGATALDLIDLRAAVANREIFLRYGVDRPAFLSSTTFKVAQDSRGRPVLAVRSTESFTEPLVNLLVELRWGKGDLIREYTLLLDPPGFASSNRAVAENRALGVDRPAEAAPVTNTAATPLVPVAPDVPAAPAAATPIVETKTQTVARQVDPTADQPNKTGGERAARKTTQIKVGAKATLRGIAWRVGERSDSDLQRMMIAIFRANPNAFDGNINRLYLGALLTIPSDTELAAISRAEAKREFHAQMSAWRTSVRAVASSSATSALAKSVSVTPVLPKSVSETVVPAKSAVATPETETLGRRVQSLEQELSQMKGLLESEQNQLVDLRQQAARAEMPPVVVAAPRALEATLPIEASLPIEATLPVEATQAKPTSRHSSLVSIVAGLGLLAAAFAALYFRLRRRLPTLNDSRSDGDAAAAHAASADAVAAAHPTVAIDGMPGTIPGPQDPVLDPAPDLAHEPLQEGTHGAQDLASDWAETDVLIPALDVDGATQPMLPAVTAKPVGHGEIATGTYLRPAPHETTVNLRIDAVKLRVDQTKLDYNLLDLDLTQQHVQMPSVLNEHSVVKERRTNLADVLQLAIEREPDRHDLRMKLLELHYAAAATNRKAFLEVVQKFARNRDFLQADQWEKIASMGRQIVPENPLFADETTADDDLAECA